MPEEIEREVLIMSVITLTGRSLSIHSYRSLAGSGSSSQVLMDIFLTVCFTCSEVTGVTHDSVTLRGTAV